MNIYYKYTYINILEQKSLDILGSGHFQFGEIHLQQTILFHVFQSEQIRFGFVEVQKPKLETRARPNQLKLKQVEPFQFELSEGIGGVVASATVFTAMSVSHPSS